MGSGDVDQGVYYRRQDYAGFWRRTVVAAVDVAVAFAALSVLTVIHEALLPTSGPALAFVLWLVLSYFYFVICKRSQARTLGYRLGGVRLVSIHGDTPSSSRVTFRLFFALLGGYSSMLGVIDWLWITGDGDRQALRDKFARTYVIKASAEPVGRGPVGYDVCHVLTWTLLFPRVQHRVDAVGGPDREGWVLPGPRT